MVNGQGQDLLTASTAFDPQQVEDESIATAYVRLAYVAALRGQKEEGLRLGRHAYQLYVQRGTMRYSLRLDEWLKNYENNAEVGALLDLARLTN
jgi:hypothetical protein